MTTKTINVAEAKKHLSDLLGRVAYGKETIIITRRGKPIAKLLPVEKEPPPRHLVDVIGKIVAPADFHRAIKQIVADRTKHKPRLLDFEA